MTTVDSVAPSLSPQQTSSDGWNADEADVTRSRESRQVSYPRFSDKYSEPSVTTPKAFAGEPLETVPHTAVLCFTKFLDAAVDQVLTSHPDRRESKVVPDLHFLNASVALVRNKSLLGAPMATVQLERLIQLGIRSFIILGIAGSLREGTNIGQIVVCDRAVRDEGTSHHYLPFSEYAWPAPELPPRLTAFLRERGINVQVGGTWTTDAIFRETALEVRRLAAEGIITVEMEAAALFSVARFRGVQLGAVFAVSDLVHRESWERGQDGSALANALSRVLPHLIQFKPDAD
jgi:nucleoside phosphorylase